MACPGNLLLKELRATILPLAEDWVTSGESAVHLTIDYRSFIHAPIFFTANTGRILKDDIVDGAFL